MVDESNPVISRFTNKIKELINNKADKTNVTQSNPGLMSAEDKIKLDAIDTQYSINVEKQSTADTGFFSTYVIKQNGTQKGVKINIPKDFLVKSATVETCTTANSPVSGYEVGDKYIDFVINSKDSTDTDEHLYLATKEIGAYPVDEVTLTVDNGKLAIKDSGIPWGKLATVVRGIINGKEEINNKVTSVSASSTDVQYPSAKCVYDNFCQKNDPRLSDARTPKSHTHDLGNLNLYADGQGGTNLIEGTQDFITPLTNVGLIEGTYQNCKYRRVNNTNGTKYVDIIFNIPAGTFKHGEKYTLSFWAKGSGSIIMYNYGETNYIKTKPIKCTSGGTNTTNFSEYNDGNVNFVLTSEWKRYFVTWELNPTSDSTNNASVNKKLILRTQVGTHAYYAGVMYERGEIPHDWSPSPKDIYREYITASSTSIADLDNYKKAGFYYNDNNNEANYIIHCPNSNGTNTPYTNNHGFFLLVEDWANNTFSVKQTLTYYDDDTIYIRRYVNGTWGTWKKILNSSNYSTYALSNANGAVLKANIADKSVTFDKMEPVVFWGGGSGTTAGYIKMIKFKFTTDAQWKDKPITFDLYNRQRMDNVHVSLKFKNVGNNDPDVDYFSYTSYQSVNLYIYKEETSTWSLIIQKELNGNMEIANLTIPNYNRDFLGYYNMNTQISELPSNTSTNPLIQATQRTYGGTSNNNITAPAFIKSGGTSAQFLKANGSVETLNTTPFTVTYTNGTTSTVNFVTR